MLQNMTFSDMGSADRSVECQKGMIMGSDIKGATVRLDDSFLELLNDVAPKIGLSRQAFMSKIIENYAVQAVADYLMGYSGFNKSAHDLFGDELDDFSKQVDDCVAFERIYHRALRFPEEHKQLKQEYEELRLKKHLEKHPELKPMFEGI